jgi:hypothetical protein
VLVYLQQEILVGILTKSTMLTDLLDYAGAYEHLAAAKWLRQKGAAWPTVFKRRHCSGAVLQWAIAEGFTPPTN